MITCPFSDQIWKVWLAHLNSPTLLNQDAKGHFNGHLTAVSWKREVRRWRVVWVIWKARNYCVFNGDALEN
ncbi:hypothetical protein Fmac_023054 [Flemingia macrophylla]|uniref:Uncharacterized protein n=1 Tax=Flemingia macrophylla TaxID=520843 RepID=A0ABD1LKD6_9FABA